MGNALVIIERLVKVNTSLVKFISRLVSPAVKNMTREEAAALSEEFLKIMRENSSIKVSALDMVKNMPKSRVIQTTNWRRNETGKAN